MVVYGRRVGRLVARSYYRAVYRECLATYSAIVFPAAAAVNPCWKFCVVFVIDVLVCHTNTATRLVETKTTMLISQCRIRNDSEALIRLGQFGRRLVYVLAS